MVIAQIHACNPEKSEKNGFRSIFMMIVTQWSVVRPAPLTGGTQQSHVNYTVTVSVQTVGLGPTRPPRGESVAAV